MEPSASGLVLTIWALLCAKIGKALTDLDTEVLELALEARGHAAQVLVQLP
jgi:hypothetical protein